MPEGGLGSVVEAKGLNQPSEKAVAKVKIDLKSTKVNKKSVDFANNNNIIESVVPSSNFQVPANSRKESPSTVKESAPSSQVCCCS